MNKVCSNCTRGAVISERQMWCVDCETAWHSKRQMKTDLEKDRQIIQTWLVDDKCEHDEYLKISRKDFDACLAAERASLPESVVEKLKDISMWSEWCGREKCPCLKDMAQKALADLGRWQRGTAIEDE